MLRRNFRGIFVGFIVMLVAILFVLLSCGKADSKGKLRVGMECAYPPFNYTETQNTESNVRIANIPGAYVDGYDVQIAKTIANELQLELEIQAISWDGLIPALQANQIDLIIAGMSKTEERLKTIDFTDAYYESEEVVVVKADGSFATATSLNDFTGARVIGQVGTIYADLVPQMVAKGAVAGTNLDTVPQIIGAINAGTVDATILEFPVAQGVVASNTNLKLIRLTDGFEVSDEDVKVSIGIRKNYDLKDRINKILSQITAAKRAELMTNAVNASGE